MENIEFLKILYGKVPEGYVGVSYIIDGKIKTKWFAVSELEDMAVFIDETGKEYNTYYGVNPRREKLPYYVRGSDKDIGYVIGVQMDFDVKGEAHKQEALPETKEELLSYIETLPINPSLLVWSGNGVHAIWLFDDPYRMSEDTLYINQILKGWELYVNTDARKKNGWVFDSVADTARMLRAPGTVNHKTEDKPLCKVISYSDYRYRTEDFESYIKETTTMTSGVCELVDRYLRTKTGVRQSTKQGYVTVTRILEKQAFGKKAIRSVKASDAKLFLIKLQQEDKKSYSSIHTIRGVLRPAFQMAVDDDILVKNPFGFQLAGVVVNDSVTREAITKEQMRKFLKFVHDDYVYCKYYEVVYILFHTGMRISEFCGLTLKDIDLKNKTVNIDHQLQRLGDMKYFIEETKTDAGKRKIPITDDVVDMFAAIIEDREAPKNEKLIDGYGGFLFYDDRGLPLVAMHWQHRFNNMVGRYNDIYRVQMPNITPHVCRHTYCSNQAKAGMNPKTLQYLMGHSDISVTMNVYTHIGFADAEEELKRMEEFRKAQAEIDKQKEKPVSQRMFKVV